MTNLSATFGGSIPEYYDRYLGPAWFDKFGADLAGRLAANPPGGVLEIACGTGLVTRRLRERLEPAVRLVATDLSRAMLDYAKAKVTLPGIEWREADACKLPFPDASFGAVVCAFGVMFFPDRGAAFAEARRVLRKGGTFLFNVWDRIEDNPHALVSSELFEQLFPGDAEMQFTRIPYGLHDRALLRGLLAGARFEELRIEPRRVEVSLPDAHSLALGGIRGTPRVALIEKRGVKVDEVIERAAAALAKVGGGKPYRSHAQALVVEARAL
ncbi:MAG TPA: class I SAM-dependent methyltransferase [Burkholderiales bacterium]|nr:class I SAM-dependent methyltransferase [Burkholderiales bacterium]